MSRAQCRPQDAGACILGRTPTQGLDCSQKRSQIPNRHDFRPVPCVMYCTFSGQYIWTSGHLQLLHFHRDIYTRLDMETYRRRRAGKRVTQSRAHLDDTVAPVGISKMLQYTEGEKSGSTCSGRRSACRVQGHREQSSSNSGE